MDVRNLGFDDATFDVAIDKGWCCLWLTSTVHSYLSRDYGCHDDC